MQSHATTFIKIGHANKFLKNFHERLAMREEFWNEENDGGEISRTVERERTQTTVEEEGRISTRGKRMPFTILSSIIFLKSIHH